MVKIKMGPLFFVKMSRENPFLNRLIKFVKRVEVFIIFLIAIMLAISKSKDLKQVMTRIFARLQHMKEVKTQFLDFIVEVEELYSSFAQKIHKQMISFEDKIIQNSLYSTSKTDQIINMAKMYQEFSLQLQKNAKISLINLEKINDKEITLKQQQLSKKSKSLLKEFGQYLKSQKEYDQYFGVYRRKCSLLDEAIAKYCNKQPISFYNQTSSSKQIKQLSSKYSDCTNFQTLVINQTQRLDLTRKELSQHIKEISDCYVSILHIYLVLIQKIINSVVDCKKEEVALKKIGLRKSSMNSWGNHSLQLEQLDSLYTQFNQNSPRHKPKDQIIEDFSDLFQNEISLNPNSSSDAKLFFDRCDNMLKKKIKTSNEILKMQRLLIQQLQSQSQNCDTFQKSYKTIEKDIFTNNGIDSYKKRFRKYFGSNFMEMEELCLAVLERQKKSFQKINKSMGSNKIKLSQIIVNKEQGIKLFEKRTKIILEEHQKLKQKIEQQKRTLEGEKQFNQNITQCFQQIKESFIQLQKVQLEMDKQFFGSLKNHNESILRFEMNKNLVKVFQKQKNRLSILASLDINSQIVLILKDDNRYDMLLNECPKPNLYQTFKSLVDKDKYDQTKKILNKKQNRLNQMVATKKGCCGNITVSMKKNATLSQHQCTLISDPKSKQSNCQRLKGSLKITSTSIIFQQRSWIPFFDGLLLTIPESDIQLFDISNNTNFKEGVQIRTQCGVLLFQSQQFNQIIQSLQKNLVFKPKELSQSRIKRNDSSSFLKNNTSTEYRVSFEKNPMEAVQNSPIQTGKSKAKTYDTLMKQFIAKWQDSELLNNNFINISKKSKSRRDYSYQSSYSKLHLKQSRQYQIKDKDIILTYIWKVSFPDSPMLNSFKHSQNVFIESANKQISIRILKNKYSEQQLYIKNKFYQQIDEMNEVLSNFIAKSFERQAKVIFEMDENCKTVDSFKIGLEDILVTERQSKLQRNESVLRNSNAQRRRSSQFNGFKTL